MPAFYRQLTVQDFSAGRDTGAKLDLSQLPDVIDGRAVYCRALSFNFTGSVTSTAGGAGNLSRLISIVNLEIPQVTQLCNVGANALARLFRLRNGGEYPPFVAPATAAAAWDGTASLAAGANVVNITAPLEFADTRARRLDDQAIPVRLLQSAKLKVTFGALTDVIADNTATTGTLTVTAELIDKAEMRCPPLPIIDTVDLTGTQPVLDPCDGKITHAAFIPSSLGAFGATTDYATGGFSFGEMRLTEDATSVNVFYDAFNRVATTDLIKHTSAVGTFTQLLPIVFPPGGTQGQHVTYEAIAARTTPRIKVNAAANGVSILRRYVLDNRSPEMVKARALLGFKSPGRPMTASHKPTQSAEVSAFVPRKAEK